MYPVCLLFDLHILYVGTRFIELLVLFKNLVYDELLLKNYFFSPKTNCSAHHFFPLQIIYILPVTYLQIHTFLFYTLHCTLHIVLYHTTYNRATLRERRNDYATERFLIRKTLKIVFYCWKSQCMFLEWNTAPLQVLYEVCKV